MKWPLLALGGLLTLAVLVSALSASLFYTESGSAWLLRHVSTVLPELTVAAPQGSLLGGDFSARLLRYEHAGPRLQIEGLRWQGLRLRRGHIELATLKMDRLEFASSPSTQAAQAPDSLELPIRVDVRQIEIGTLQASGEQIDDIAGSVSLGATHHLTLRHLRWDLLQADGDLQLNAAAPLQLQGQLHLRPADSSALPWTASAQVQGPLADLRAQLQLQAAQQSLQAQVHLRPFEPWPLHALDAEMTSLDLAAFSSRLPQTRLSGHASLNSSSWQQPAELQAHMTNALAGPWDRARLPVQALQLVLAARPDQPERLQLQSLDARLGSPAQPGGRVQASGQRDVAGWTLNARFDDLQAQALDSRLTALHGSGTARLSQPSAGPLNAELDIGLALAARPLRMRARASLNGKELTLQEAKLSAGAAATPILSAQGHANLGAKPRVDLKAQMQDFDPALFWSAFKTPSHLNALLDARLQLGSARPQGQAHLQLQASSLAGLPLSGRIDYASDPHTKAALLSGQLDGAGNRLAWQASLPVGGVGGALHASASLQAPQLATLKPLLALWRPDIPLAGAADGTLQLETDVEGNHWSSTGALNASDLTLGPQHLAHGQLTWQAAQALDAPLKLQAQADDGKTRLTLNLAGTWAQHQLTAHASGPLNIPAALQNLWGAGPLTAEVSASLNGSLSAAPDLLGHAPLRWQGHQLQVQLRPQGQPDWLSTQDLILGIHLDEGWARGPDALTLAPGRMVLGSASLSWQHLDWHAARTQAEAAPLTAQLQLDALDVAPLLQRWQPDMGWGGDLKIGGSFSLSTSPAIELNAVIERLSGDLHVQDDQGQTPLGLADLRLALQAHDGVWRLSEALSGPGMGSLKGTLTARAASPSAWPNAQSAIGGEVQAQAAHVDHWGRWVPPGWRLAGALTAGFKIAGTASAPLLTGEAQGEGLALSNPLLGVDVRDLGFLLKLDGREARLERFSAHGGGSNAEGNISMTGGASLGEQAHATLKLQSNGFALLNRVDRRLLVSGNAEMQLAERSLDLNGQFKIDSGLIDISHGDTPSLDDDVQVIRPTAQPSSPSSSAPTGAPRRTRIALQLDLGDQLELRGHGLDSRLEGLLKLNQTDGALSVTGNIKTVGGTYAAYGQKLDISRGVLTFVGPYDNPRLDVLALRPNLDVEVGVRVTGTALSPHVELYADPDMADIDKLSWLVTGSASDSLGRSDTALLQAAALALLSGEGESPSGRLLNAIGLDKLSVAQSDDSTQGTIVSVGKQVSRRWYVGYERGLNATSGSWQLIYRIAQRFTLRAQGGDQNSLDLIWQWKWD